VEPEGLEETVEPEALLDAEAASVLGAYPVLEVS
jgi:hypothetical protein